MAKRPLRFIDNLRLSGHEGLWQLAIEQGRIAHLVPQPEGQEWRSDVLDAQGGLALPAFVEPHIHRYHANRRSAGPNQSGTLFEGIERWAERKALLTHEDVKQRARKRSSGRSPTACSMCAPTLTFPIPRRPRCVPCWR